MGEYKETWNMASGGSDNAFSLPSSASRSSKTFVDDYGMYNLHFLGLYYIKLIKIINYK